MVLDPALLGREAQSVVCLTTDVCLTADPEVACSIPARSHTFVEIDHEINNVTILFSSLPLLVHHFLSKMICFTPKK